MTTDPNVLQNLLLMRSMAKPSDSFMGLPTQSQREVLPERETPRSPLGGMQHVSTVLKTPAGHTVTIKSPKPDDQMDQADAPPDQMAQGSTPSPWNPAPQGQGAGSGIFPAAAYNLPPEHHIGALANFFQTLRGNQ